MSRVNFLWFPDHGADIVKMYYMLYIFLYSSPASNSHGYAQLTVKACRSLVLLPDSWNVSNKCRYPRYKRWCIVKHHIWRLQRINCLITLFAPNFVKWSRKLIVKIHPLTLTLAYNKIRRISKNFRRASPGLFPLDWSKRDFISQCGMSPYREKFA